MTAVGDKENVGEKSRDRGRTEKGRPESAKKKQ